MPGLTATSLKRRREKLGFDQERVASLIPCADDPTQPWPRALLSMVENRKVSVRGLTRPYALALQALEVERTHNHGDDRGCRAGLRPCGHPVLSCLDACPVCEGGQP